MSRDKPDHLDLDQTPALLLIDGSSYLYRAYHAFPPLTAPSGEAVGSIFGFLGLLKRIFQITTPTYCAVVFDPPGKTFRAREYAEYKSHREKMPPLLEPQIGPLLSILGWMGLKILIEPGEEADDVIGTLARQGQAEGLRVQISSSDKDLAQLVHEKNPCLIDYKTGEAIGAPQIFEKYGVRPDQIVDFLALIGDQADNLPGVPGVGLKSAVALLSAFGSLDVIYASLDQLYSLPIRGIERVRRALEQGKSSAYLTQSLAKIRDQLPLEITLEQLKVQPPELEQLTEAFEKYGFKSWISEIKNRSVLGRHYCDPIMGAKTPAPRSLCAVTRSQVHFLCLDAFERWVQKKAAQAPEDLVLAFSYSSEANVKIEASAEAGVVLAAGDRVTWIPAQSLWADLESPPSLGAKLFHDCLYRLPGPKLVYHAKAFWHWLAQWGAFPPVILWDPMLASYVDNALNAHQISALIDRHLGKDYCDSLEMMWELYPTPPPDPKRQTLMTLAQQAVAWLALYPVMITHFAAHYPEGQQVLDAIELPLIPVLFQMEQWGIQVNPGLLKKQAAALAQTAQEIERQVHLLSEAVFNLNSSQQVQQILFEKLSLPQGKRTPKGVLSTSEEVLSRLGAKHPVPELILKYREISKLRNTYAQGLQRMVDPFQRIHTTYQQAQTSTGRLSSIQPNLQNIPNRTEVGRKLRDCFVAAPGYCLVSADYSQIELRILAHYSQDPTLLKAFQSDTDVHSQVACDLFGVAPHEVTGLQRQKAKTITFGLIYGMSAFGIANQLKISRTEAQQHLERYFRQYPGVLSYLERTRESAIEQGYVQTFSGRRWYCPKLKDLAKNAQAAPLRAAVNAPIQGTAAEMIKLAMIQIARWIQQRDHPETIRMLLQVHDELLFEIVPEHLEAGCSQIAFEMEQALSLTVPIRVNIGTGQSWTEAH